MSHRSSLSGLARRAVRSVADLVVPPLCLACHARLDRQDALCGACWRGVAFIRAPLCDRLGIPLPFGPTEGPLVSAAATADPPAWLRARAAALYEPRGVVAGLIHAMKYADRHDARRLLARWLLEAGRELLADADLIVPVPLSRLRLIRRQFNQSALLVREVSAMSGVPWSHAALVKTRDTQPQVELSGVARRTNLRGAFRVPERRRAGVAGRRILLLDDVMTTGATAEAATLALLAAGAARVDVLTVARVPPSVLAAP